MPLPALCQPSNEGLASVLQPLVRVRHRWWQDSTAEANPLAAHALAQLVELLDLHKAQSIEAGVGSFAGVGRRGLPA